MPGVAIVEYTVAPEDAEEATRRVAEAVMPAAREMPGYRGFLLIDRGDGRRMGMVLCKSDEAAAAIAAALVPIGREQTYPLMQGRPARSLGAALVMDGALG